MNLRAFFQAVVLVNLISLALFLLYQHIMFVMMYSVIFFGVVIYIFNIRFNPKIEKAIKLVLLLALILDVLAMMMIYCILLLYLRFLDLPISPYSSQLDIESQIIIALILNVLPVILGFYYIFNVKSLFQIRKNQSIPI